MIRLVALLSAVVGCPMANAQTTPYQNSADFEKFARKLREKALLKMDPQVVIPATSRPLNRPLYPWRNNIVATLIAVGENKDAAFSAWDSHWQKNYGGADPVEPSARHGFIPAAFAPKLNPFYAALPYNDVQRETTKPEARSVIPWFKEAFVAEGRSVCRDRWMRIRSHTGKDCYAQWGDCGPYRTDHWQYVFGDERPKPNLSQGAGLSVSPAVRDYLGTASTDVVDWQFVDFKDVPKGPWSMYGENNPFVRMGRQSPAKAVSPSPRTIQSPEIHLSPDQPPPAPEANVITR